MQDRFRSGRHLLGGLLLGSCLLGRTSLTAQVRDSSDPALLPAFDRTRFTRIFDGATLKGWDGDPTYWSVHDGVLVGTVTPETLLKKNSWIVWRGGRVEDFELVLDYRVSAGGNSGIGYRLAVLEDDPFSVRGPQADILGGDMFTGICYEENGRRLLAARGHSTRIDEAGNLPRLVSQFGDPEELQGVVHREGWNRYRLVVEGHDARHFLNGVLMSEVHDHDERNRMKVGLLGVQVHVGPPMTIEFRDVFLRHIGTRPEGSTDRGSLSYRSGTLLEREHAPSFENLVAQTARVTAASAPTPLDGRRELVVVTRALATVRHDLVDRPLYGGSKAQVTHEERFDLVVMSGDLTIRVPNAGHLLVGRPLDRDYRVELRWDAETRAYEVVGMAPVDTSRGRQSHGMRRIETSSLT